jgi:hypothetical protein
MRRWFISIALMVAIAPMVPARTSGQDSESSGRRFSITVTNLTAGQTFTPILAASHQAGVKLFTLGSPASVPLEILAEAGDVAPLRALLSSSPKVLDTTDSGAPLPPGASVTLFVSTRGSFDHVSVAAMLVPTNDGFFAVNDHAGPGGEKTITLYSPAYDAGTEADDESCLHIPGPPDVCQGEGFNPARDDVNFVHIHGGIHGIGDLKADVYDWRNPVAQITIRRVR